MKKKYKTAECTAKFVEKWFRQKGALQVAIFTCLIQCVICDRDLLQVFMVNYSMDKNTVSMETL